MLVAVIDRWPDHFTIDQLWQADLSRRIVYRFGVTHVSTSPSPPSATGKSRVCGSEEDVGW